MTISTQEYANLSWHAYKAPQINEKKSRERGETTYEDITLDGITYTPLEHIDNKETGYQGTIYQRKDTGEIVAAHRGTEPRDPNDLLTDASMIFARVNAQAADAEKLVEHALEHARKYAVTHPNDPTPEVTITGHSLGGALAQITASKSGLHGETFNPYGAVSLNMGIPEGGNTVINHVMATDPASAASQHFGQVRVYATEKEIQTLSVLGYANDPFSQTMITATTLPGVRAVGTAGTMIAGIGSHFSSNFANTDEQGRHHPSVLTGPQAHQCAEQYATMIQIYRGDVQMARATLSAMGDVVIATGNTASKAAQYYGQAVEADAKADAQLSSAIAHAAERTYDSARKTISEGIDAVQHKADQAVTSAQKSFLDNALRLSGAASQALERVGLGPPNSGAHARQLSSEPTPTATQPTPARGAAQPAQGPFDPRHPQHPEHAMYQSVREQLVALNKTEGITLNARQLDNCTAAVMSDARSARMRSVTCVLFSQFENGQTDPSQVVAFQGDPDALTSRATATNMTQAVNTPAEQSFQQFAQNTQTMERQQQQLEQQRLAEQQPQGRGMHM